MAEFDSVIPAGGSGTLTAKIKTTATQKGAISKSVAVTTDAPGAQRMTLSVSFKLVTAISVIPRAQMSLNGVFGDQPSSTLIVRRHDRKRLEITGVENNDPRIVVRTEPVTEETNIGRLKAIPGDVLLSAGIADGLEAVSANGRFKMMTNHPDAKVVDISYSLRLRPVIEVRPVQQRLLLQEGNSNARTTLFRIQHNRQGQFKLTGATPSDPELFRVQLVDGDAEQQVHTVAVMLQEDVEPGSLDGRVLESIVITTDDPEQTELSVPVLIEPRTMRRPGRPKAVE